MSTGAVLWQWCSSIRYVEKPRETVRLWGGVSARTDHTLIVVVEEFRDIEQSRFCIILQSLYSATVRPEQETATVE